MKQTRILWVEDDYYRLRGLVRPLELQGIEVVFKDNLRSAIELLDARERFDLFLIDLIIPEAPAGDTIDRPLTEYAGMEFIKAVRKRYKLSTPIIALSVVGNETVLQKGRKYDAVVLRKGICTPTELHAEILRALGVSADH